MARNVEIKARLKNPSAMRLRVQSLGGIGPEELLQIDTFFDVSLGRLKLREFADGTGELIFYERPDAEGPTLSDYVRAPAQDPVALREALARSCGVRAIVRKRRAVFLLGQTRIHLDEVDGVGSFVEVEVVLHDGQSVADGEAVATDLLDALSVSQADLIARAYVDLLETPSGPPPASRARPQPASGQRVERRRR